MLGGTAKEKNQDSFLVPNELKRGGIFPILFGKTLSYITIYTFNCVLTMVWVHSWFNYPNKGSYLTVLLLTLPFLLSVIFMGITISVLFKRRESSIMLMVFLSPIAIFLSGVSWPASSIPPFLYHLAHMFPSTIVIPAYLRIRAMGVGMESIRSEYIQLLVQMVVYFFTAVLALYISTRHNAARIFPSPSSETDGKE